MGGRVWLPLPALLLAALPLAPLRGAAGFTPSLDSDFTFTLPAGRKECFYQPMPLKGSLEIEYQVSAGAAGGGPGRTRGSRAAGLLGASAPQAPGSLEPTSLACPKIDTYPPSSLSSGRKEASTGDVGGVTPCFLIHPQLF